MHLQVRKDLQQGVNQWPILAQEDINAQWDVPAVLNIR